MLYFLSSLGVKGEKILLGYACYTELVSIALRESVGVIMTFEVLFRAYMFLSWALQETHLGFGCLCNGGNETSERGREPIFEDIGYECVNWIHLVQDKWPVALW
jgi:hypothetical protein